MLICKQLRELPDNFSVFLEEMATGYAALYGAKVATKYREIITPSLSQSIQLPQVMAFGLYDGVRVVGMIMGVIQMGTGKIVFIHVLEDYRERGVEAHLVQACVEALEQQTPSRIECETIPLYSVDLKQAFNGLGFHCINRALLGRALGESDKEVDGNAIRPMTPEDEDEAVACIVAAYQDHPDGVLHQDLHHVDAAMALLRRFQSGAFGPVEPEWIRVVENEMGCCGVILGHSMPPDTGFAFQLAVHPDAQGAKRGTELLKSLMASMAASGMQRVLLGVTVSNPALGLYTRLGFRVVWHVDVFVRNR